MFTNFVSSVNQRVLDLMFNVDTKNKRNLLFCQVLVVVKLPLSVTAASLAQAIKVLNMADVNLFCCDTSSIQDRSIFFRSVSLLIS